jgi:hypothetical protein
VNEKTNSIEYKANCEQLFSYNLLSTGSSSACYNQHEGHLESILFNTIKVKRSFVERYEVIGRCETATQLVE